MPQPKCSDYCSASIERQARQSLWLPTIQKPQPTREESSIWKKGSCLTAAVSSQLSALSHDNFQLHSVRRRSPDRAVEIDRKVSSIWVRRESFSRKRAVSGDPRTTGEWLR